MNAPKSSRYVRAAILVVTVLPLAANAASVRPCEDVLKEMRATKASATLAPDVKSKVDALETKLSNVATPMTTNALMAFCWMP